jgi:hypothetical protein
MHTAQAGNAFVPKYVRKSVPAFMECGDAGVTDTLRRTPKKRQNNRFFPLFFPRQRRDWLLLFFADAEQIVKMIPVQLVLFRRLRILKLKYRHFPAQLLRRYILLFQLPKVVLFHQHALVGKKEKALRVFRRYPHLYAFVPLFPGQRPLAFPLELFDVFNGLAGVNVQLLVLIGAIPEIGRASCRERV